MRGSLARARGVEGRGSSAAVESRAALLRTRCSLDNSEYTRNGDYQPTRLEAQVDAATLLANVKTQQNHENTVGLLGAAGT